MTAFSANLGFLWAELPLPDAIRAARRAGFDAVECHWPYDVPASEVKTALRETGMRMLGINTDKGDGFGLCALPDRESEARASINTALDYAAAIGAGNVHVMAGCSTGAKAWTTFAENLIYACKQAAPLGVTILIEPINGTDVPGYFLQDTHQAIEIIRQVDKDNLKLMFDCYHVQLVDGDVVNRLSGLMPHIGHIQFASVPDRGPPDQGELDYATVFKTIADLGYDAPLGAEYRPCGPTQDTLGWLSVFR